MVNSTATDGLLAPGLASFFRRVASTSYTISRTCPLLIPFRQCQPMCTRNGMRKPGKAFAHQVSPRLSGRSTGSDKQLLTGCMKSGMMTLLQNPLLRRCLSQQDVTERLNASKNASPSRSPCIPHQALAKKKKNSNKNLWGLDIPLTTGSRDSDGLSSQGYT